MKRLIGILAIVIAAAIGGQIGREGYTYLSTEYQRATFSEDKLERILEKEELFRSIKAALPKEYDDLIAELTSLVASGRSKQLVKDESVKATARIRKRYADKMALAPDEDLKELIRLSRDLHLKVLKNEGPRICNQLAIKGVVGLGEHATRYSSEASHQGSVYFIAVGRAIETPIVRSEPSDSDWGEVADFLLKAGSPEGYLDVLAAMNPDDPNLCPALIAFMNAMVTISGETGQRLRASFVKGIAGS